jgi:hypothetical protein
VTTHERLRIQVECHFHTSRNIIGLNYMKEAISYNYVWIKYISIQSVVLGLYIYIYIYKQLICTIVKWRLKLWNLYLFIYFFINVGVRVNLRAPRLISWTLNLITIKSLFFLRLYMVSAYISRPPSLTQLQSPCLPLNSFIYSSLIL